MVRVRVTLTMATLTLATLTENTLTLAGVFLLEVQNWFILTKKFASVPK